MPIIRAEGLTKTYRVADKQPGLRGTLRHFFQRRHRLVPAVQEINIAIEPGDETSAFSVIVPDLPGCFSAGDTLDEAVTNAEEAAAGWVDA